jgi:plastocyanin
MEQAIVRRGGVWFAIALSLVVIGCGSDDPTGNGGGGGGGNPVVTTSVSVRDNLFDPAAIRVSPGATVTWTFVGGIPHNVNFPSTAISDSNNQTSGTFSTAMPTAPGTYNYSCTLHPGMNGSVQVQ